MQLNCMQLIQNYMVTPVHYGIMVYVNYGHVCMGYNKLRCLVYCLLAAFQTVSTLYGQQLTVFAAGS
jgi:hypothetical protein